MLASGLPVAALASPVIRQALIPMAVFYVILMTALGLGLLGLRRRGTGQVSGPAAVPGSGRGWAAFARHVIGTAAGGYLLLQAVALAYYYLIARVGGAFLSSAITGTALLIGLTAPVYAAAAWLAAKTGGRPGKPPGEGRPPPAYPGGRAR